MNISGNIVFNPPILDEIKISKHTLANELSKRVMTKI